MKYVKSRETYISDIKNRNKIILESSVFENDIRWGDSLLGRLINSFIRKGVIEVKHKLIPKYLKDLEAELARILQLGLDESEENEIKSISFKYVLWLIGKAVRDGESVEWFIGNVSPYNEGGQLNNALELAGEIEFNDKKEIVSKLEKFKGELIKIANSGNNNTNDDENLKNLAEFCEKSLGVLEDIVKICDYIKMVEGEYKKLTGDWITNQKKLGKNVKPGEGTRKLLTKKAIGFIDTQLVSDPINSSILYNVPSVLTWLPIFESTHSISKKEEIYTEIRKYYDSSNISKYVDIIREIVNESKNEDEPDEIKRNNRYKSVVIAKQLLDKKSDPTSEPILKFIEPLLKFKNNAILNSIEDLGKFITSFNKNYEEMLNLYSGVTIKESIIFKYSRFILESSDSTDPIVIAWRDCFSDGDERKWMDIDENKKKELEEKYESKSNNRIEMKVDPIIRIVNIFGKAYRTYCTTVIPSGRSNGAVSQKTFREYTYVGSGSGGQWRDGDMSNAGGPWINNRIFKKWEDGVTKILEDPKWRKFLANPNFIFNDVKGAGQILMKFIIALIDRNSLGNYDKYRTNLLAEYFNIKDYSGMNISSPRKPTEKDITTENKAEAGQTEWQNHSNIDGAHFDQNYKNKFFLIKNEENGNKYILNLIEIENIDNDKYVYYKISREHSTILEYIDDKKPPTSLTNQLKTNNYIHIGRSKLPISKNEDLELVFYNDYEHKKETIKIKGKNYRIYILRENGKDIIKDIKNLSKYHDDYITNKSNLEK